MGITCERHIIGESRFTWILMSQNIIKCPACAVDINVSEILYQQVADQIRHEYESKHAQSAQEIHDKMKKLEAEKKEILKEKDSIQQTVESEVKAKLNLEKSNLEKSIRKSLSEETSEQIKSLQVELEQKSFQVKELNKTKAEIEKLKREKDELRDAILLEKEKEYSEKLKDERLKIQKQSDDASLLKIRELENQLEVQKNLAIEMQRKANQGSMQLQGEVQELAIEELLKEYFPSDLIEEVGKGVKGADIVQTIRDKTGKDCGVILYESKRTKAFSNEWISKLKSDAVSQKANVCVLITEALPDGISSFGLKEGVWVCTFRDFKGLVLLLRDSLIKISDAYHSQTNKGEKMQMLYDYLTSAEFKNQIEAVLNGFAELQMGYLQEKNQMEKIWKKREKQLEKIMLNTNYFIGSVQGIAGTSIQEIKLIDTNDSNLIE